MRKHGHYLGKLIITKAIPMLAGLGLWGAAPDASGENILAGRAVLPARTLAAGPTSGTLLGSAPINGQSVPFVNQQPVQGFSAVHNNGNGTYLVMSDNGFGSLENSADFLLRVYTIRPNFKTRTGGNGTIDVLGFFDLKDPDKKIPFTITHQFSTNRVLTGADFDLESMQRAPDGTFWFGDEFGPFLLHTDATGRLLDAPIPLPDLDNPGKEIRSPQSPFNEEASAVRIMNAVRAHAQQHGNMKAPVFSPYHVMLDDANTNTFVPNRALAPAGSGLAASSSEIFNVASIKSAGYPVVTWTVNDKPRMLELMRLRVNGIISDRPDLLLEAVREFDADTNGVPDFLDADGLIDITKFDAQGHRGGRDLRPENTLPAMETALDFLMTTLELDTGVTSDEVPVLGHDPYIKAQKFRRLDGASYGETNEVLIRNVTAAQIQSTYVGDKLFRGPAQTNDPALSPVSVAFAASKGLRHVYVMPTLQQLFDFVPFYVDYYQNGAGKSHTNAARRAKNAARVRFNIETKLNPRTDRDLKNNVFTDRTVGVLPFARAVAQLIMTNNLAERADIQSFDFRSLITVQEQFPRIRTVYLFGDFPKFADPTIAGSDEGTNLQDHGGANTPWLAGLTWPYRVTQLSHPFRSQRSGGFEGMALAPDGRKLYPLLEKPLVGGEPNTLLIHEFDLATKSYSSARHRYFLNSRGTAIGDFILFGGKRGLVIERDDTQGTLTGFKAIYEIELNQPGEAVTKRLAANLIQISDPHGLSAGGATNDVGLGKTFAFPFVTIESVLFFGPRQIGVINDNNYPFSIGRHVGAGLPDDNEFILIDLDQPLGAALNRTSAIFFGSDGMRPDLMERYANDGTMPTYRVLLGEGARGANGMLQAFPPNTGVGWTTMATGAWPGRHGSMNNTFHVACCSSLFGGSTSAFQSNTVDGVLIQARTLAESAELAGKTVVAVEWPASRNFAIRGKAIDFRAFFSGRGVTGNYRRSTDNTNLVAASGLDFDIAPLQPAAGWTNVPASHSPALQAVMIVRDFGLPKYNHDLYIYDSSNDGTMNYDRVLVTRSPGQGATGKDGSKPSANLKAGEWAEIRLPIVGGASSGRTAGFYVKLEELNADASRFRFYHTSLSRVTGNDPALEEYCANNFAAPTAADFAPLQAGIVSEETYVEQGLFWQKAHHAILEYLIRTYHPDLVMAGFPVTDEFSHQFFALISPTTPVFDDSDRNGQRDGRAAIREGFLKQAYAQADATLGLIRRLMPANSLVVAGSDHGFSPSWKSIGAGKVLLDAGVQTAEQTANGRSRSTNDMAKAAWAGGTAAIYLNVAGRDMPGPVAMADYEATRQKIKKAFLNLVDPANGQKVIERVFLKEELSNVQGGNSLHATRSGDVVVVSKPGYQFDAATAGQAVADAPFFGQHGYLPDTVDMANNVNLRATFLASGPMIRPGTVLEDVRAVDLEPTIGFALDLPSFGTKDGRVLREIFAERAPTLPHLAGSGDTTANSTVLWTRSTQTGNLRFEWSTDPQFTGGVRSNVVAVTDAAVPAKLTVTNLTAATEYFYRVTDAAGSSVTGSFRTPAPIGVRHGLRFGVTGDWRGELRPYPGLANAADRALDFFIKLGDTIYADYPSPAVTNAQARTLAEFRAKHAEALTARHGLNAIADVQLGTSVLATIDDHEVVNDFAGGAAPSSDTRFDQTGTLINETQLYKNGLQAFHEFNPIRTLTYDTPGQSRTHGKPKLYRAQTYGSDAALLLLDARSFRDRELDPAASATDPVQVAAFLSRSFDIDPVTRQPLPRRTMLGAAQLADLKADLATAQQAGVTWKFIIVPEPIQNLGVTGAADRFEGYAAERTELLKHIADQRIENVVFIAADIHGTLVNNLTYQAAPGQPQIPTSAFEVTTGPLAFDAPLGPTVLSLAEGIRLSATATLLSQFLAGLNLPNRAAFDALLTRAQKDAALEGLINSQVQALGYSPLGLADSSVRATLRQGGYVAAFAFGWTEFEIDAATQALTVTTYGIPAYSASETAAAVTGRRPEIVSQFVALPGGPRLTAVRSGATIRVRWPRSAAGAVLQVADRLGDSSAWSNVTAGLTVEGDDNVLAVNAEGTKFFRLTTP
jgi:glycerophosphoryl diester phosphodiesterase